MDEVIPGEPQDTTSQGHESVLTTSIPLEGKFVGVVGSSVDLHHQADCLEPDVDDSDKTIGVFDWVVRRPTRDSGRTKDAMHPDLGLGVGAGCDVA